MKYKQRLVLFLILLVCLVFLSLTFSFNTEQEDLTQNNLNPNRRNIHMTSEPEDHVTPGPTTPPPPIDYTRPWKIWSDWVREDVLYPNGVLHSNEMDLILHGLSSYPITRLDLGYKGTQLKASMYLEGGQRTVFKPMRFSRDAIVDGPDDPCRGQDRHNGEIASFHLESILGYRLAPPVAGRKINLTELLPVTSKALHDTYLTEDGNTCFYGKCLYCKPSERACGKGDIMEGSVTIWLPDWFQMKTYRHPYQRTYIPDVKAKWEVDDDYCRTRLLTPNSYYYNILPDVFDTMVLDFLVGNADRHHFETYALHGLKEGRLMHIDNGKSFGNPNHDEMSILTPLKQCCKLRNSTWEKLRHLKTQGLSQLLDKSLKRDPLYPVLTQPHLSAIDRRLDVFISEVLKCIQQYGRSNVLFDKWPQF